MMHEDHRSSTVERAADISSQRTAAASCGPGSGIYLAFGPWVLFSLIAQHGTLQAAAVIALAGSAALAGWAARRTAALSGIPDEASGTSR